MMLPRRLCLRQQLCLTRQISLLCFERKQERRLRTPPQPQAQLTQAAGRQSLIRRFFPSLLFADYTDFALSIPLISANGMHFENRFQNEARVYESRNGLSR